MFTFLLQLLFSSFLLADSAHALLITPTAKKLEKDKQTLENVYRARLIMSELADLSPEEIDRLPESEKPSNRIQSKLSPTMISLIEQYAREDFELPQQAAPAEEEVKEEEEEKKAREKEQKREHEQAIAAALRDQCIIPPHGAINVQGINIKQNNIESEINKGEAFYAEMAKIRRNLTDNHKRLNAQKKAEERMIITTTLAGIPSLFFGLRHLTNDFKKLFENSAFANRFPQLHARLNDAFFGAIASEVALIYCMAYQIYTQNSFHNPFPNHNHQIPYHTYVNALSMFGYYMTLDLAHKYGIDTLAKKINFEKDDGKLQEYLADPDIDINYTVVKGKLGWLAKTLMAAYLASTRT